MGSVRKVDPERTPRRKPYPARDRRIAIAMHFSGVVFCFQAAILGHINDAFCRQLTSSGTTRVMIMNRYQSGESATLISGLVSDEIVIYIFVSFSQSDHHISQSTTFDAAEEAWSNGGQRLPRHTGK